MALVFILASGSSGWGRFPTPDSKISFPHHVEMLQATVDGIDEHLPSPMDLPTLTENPLRHPDCCCSLSSILLHAITSHLCENMDTGLVLSIGSGAGLLEALLHSMWTSFFASPGRKLHIEGVEVIGSETSVLHSPNRYLPEECFDIVKNSWALSSRVKQAAALMFVYPRSTELVRRYMEEAALFSDTLHLALWLGPSCDWAEFEPCFTVGKKWIPVRVMYGKEVGLFDYETMAIIKKS